MVIAEVNPLRFDIGPPTGNLVSDLSVEKLVGLDELHIPRQRIAFNPLQSEAVMRHLHGCLLLKSG
jgi:hypothetical protein